HQLGFFERLTARSVDDERRWFHHFELAHAEHAAGFSGQNHVHRHEIGLLQQFFQRNHLDTEGSDGLRLDVRIVAEHFYTPGAETFCADDVPAGGIHDRTIADQVD